MKRNYGWLLLLLAIVVLLGGGTVAYRLLGQMTNPTVPVETNEAGEPVSSQKEAADFTVYDGDGAPVTLQSKRGKPVLINFWATWCAPCRSELADIDEAYKTYGDKVEFMMVNLTDGNSETVEGVRDFIAENGYTFPVYYDSDESAALAWGVGSIPMTVLIGPDGKYLHTQIGVMSADTIENLIQMLLAAEG